MRRTDILLAALVVVLAVGLILGPPLFQKWRQSGAPGETVAVEEQEPITEAAPRDDAAENAALSEKAEVERVSGMLMLYQACANRIDGFDDKGRTTLEAWKERNAETLAKRGGEPDFHIVLADPEGVDRSGENAREEELALCERNLEAMKADLEETTE